jgi:hypothetical protein
MTMITPDWEPSIQEVLLPEQFTDIWNLRGRGPGEALALAVLEQAIRDLRRGRYARKRREQRIYMDAYAWIRSDTREHVFSFVNICEALGLSADVLRSELLNPGVRESSRIALSQAA